MDNPRLYVCTVFIIPKMWKIHVFEVRASRVLSAWFIPKIFGWMVHFSKIQQFLHFLEILLVSFLTICSSFGNFRTFWSNRIPYIFSVFRKLFLVRRIYLISIRALVFLNKFYLYHLVDHKRLSLLPFKIGIYIVLKARQLFFGHYTAGHQCSPLTLKILLK